MILNKTKKIDFTTKYSFLRITWFLINNLILNSCFPFITIKVFLLKIFGAKIGKDVFLGKNIYIKYPENLILGNNVWIGNFTIFDNVSKIVVEDNVCISQYTTLVASNRDFKNDQFNKIDAAILIKQNSWISSCCKIGPNTFIQENSFIKFGSIISGKIK
jgi:putative colanic acid biosynthesis acetyltransferase WcaF